MAEVDVVVLGRNYTSLLGMIRAAGVAGYRVGVVKTCANPGKEKKTPDYFSKYVREYVYVKEHDTQGLVHALRSRFTCSGAKVVLLPTDDWVASTLDTCQAQLGEAYVCPHIPDHSGDVLKIMDKATQKLLAQEAGLPVARGWQVELRNHAYTLPEDICYPVFVKPQVSILGTKRFMKRCDTREELDEVLQAVAQKGDCPILLEAYVEIEKEYGVLGLCNRDQVLLPARIDKRVIGSGAHKGVTMVGQVQPMEAFPELQARLSAFLAKLGFVGLIDIDLYESGGVVYFNELNMRLGAFGYAAVLAGVNMPQTLIELLRGNPDAFTQARIHEGVTCISEKVNLEDYVDGFADLTTYRKRLADTPLGFIRSEEDPRPYWWLQYILLKQRIKKMLGM